MPGAQLRCNRKVRYAHRRLATKTVLTGRDRPPTLTLQRVVGRGDGKLNTEVSVCIDRDVRKIGGSISHKDKVRRLSGIVAASAFDGHDRSHWALGRRHGHAAGYLSRLTSGRGWGSRARSGYRCRRGR
jgi:hypothetical protein